MARYEHLPIYRAAFDLAVHVEKLVRGFNRYHKYSLGTELRERSRELLAPVRLHARQPCCVVNRDHLKGFRLDSDHGAVGTEDHFAKGRVANSGDQRPDSGNDSKRSTSPTIRSARRAA